MKTNHSSATPVSGNLRPILGNRLWVYAQLMRIEKPIGTLLLLWPTWWALLVAGNGRPDWRVVLAFTLGTWLMRSAGCVINDYADRHIDAAVARTQARPFAQNKVSSKEALILTLVLCLLALLCLIPLNRLTWWMSLPALFLALTYPFTKRFFPIPQFYLGLAFSFGIPMAFTALTNHIPPLAWLIFAANVCWTLAYDTIYAMADKEDDINIGIQSSALTFGQYDVTAVMCCHACFTLLMMAVGWQIHASWPYWVAVPVVVYWQYQQYQVIVSRDRWRCFHTFLRNNRIGLVWFLALVCHYLWQAWMH